MATGGATLSLPPELPRASRSLSLLRDDRLAARASKGDRIAFAELYRRHHQRLFRYCSAILHNAEDAADAFQTTMTKALVALESGETVRGVRPWLFRIAHNTSIDTVRGRRPQLDIDELVETESSSFTAPSAASEAEDRAELLEAVADIQNLPDRQAGALVMRELSGLSYPDIAAAFDISAGNARQLVHSARSTLHAMRSGRDMDCEVVRLALSEAEGKTPRDRRVRAHLASCEDCRAFKTAIRTRRSALAAVAPPLSYLAAADILARVLAEGRSSGVGLAAAGGTVGALGKLVGASGATKLAGGAAALGTAVVAGGLAAGGVLAGGSEPPRFLMPNVPELRPLPMPAPAPERAARRTPAREPAPAASARTSALDRTALVQRGPVSPVAPTVIVSDGGAEPGRAEPEQARPAPGAVHHTALSDSGGSVEKVFGDLIGRLDLRLGPIGLSNLGGSVERVLGDLVSRLNLRLDRGVAVEPKLPADPGVPAKPAPRIDRDRRVNRKATVDTGVVAKLARLADRELPVNREHSAALDVAVKPKLRADSDVRAIDPPETPPIEPELLSNRRMGAAGSDGASFRPQTSPERRRAQPPRLDPPIRTTSPRRKAVTRRRGLSLGR